MRRDSEDKRIAREIQEYTEALAAIQSDLFVLEAANDEQHYNELYDAKMGPMIVSCKRALGSEMFTYCMRDAGQLARIMA